MMRVNSVLAAENGRGTKENPAEAAAGLSEDKSEKADVWFTGEAFSASFRTMTQARDLIDDLVGTWRSFDEGRQESEIEDWERAVLGKTLRSAETIYRECYRGFMVHEFKTFFGHDYETFEVSLNELKRIYGGA